MIKKTQNNITSSIYPINQKTEMIRKAEVLFVVLGLLTIGIISFGIVQTILFISLILAFFVVTHTLLKLTSIFTPWSKTYVKSDPNYKPYVSIHVACKSEPADVVIKTVQALTELRYSNYEVVVINSNSLDSDNWQKIRKYVISCGKNYKFIHLDKVAGFKAGALNYLNAHGMDKSAEIAAIVDCDYIVSPDFLNQTVGYFKDKRIGIVQAPQNYYNKNRYNVGLFYEYRSFFRLVMHQAQRLNLVTFTGTMGLIRAELLNKGLKWNEWCITEDVEAGTYINSIGYKGVYVDKSLGKGLMPFDYASIIKQRQRWAYGNMQIIRKDLFHVVVNHGLSIKQKIAFLAQLATWFHFELIIASLYLLTATLITFGNKADNLVLANNLMIYLLVFSLLGNLIYFVVGMRKDCSILNSLKAFLTHYGLLYVMSSSWLICLLGHNLGFNVTKKEKQSNGIPIEQYYREFTVAILLLIGLIITLLRGNICFLNLAIIMIFIVVELMGISYLYRAFVGSYRLSK